ncbi:hypothetical protein ACHAWF_015851, partial [Thalassiosira exigua]
RKHRKTHGKISFKDLTEIISKNWAIIDAETKDYCTRISEMGRKRYKQQMARFNASQKILQLKKEHAAMEHAKEKRPEIIQSKDCDSPSRPGKGEPDRISSHHAPIVTPPRAPPNQGYNNRTPIFVPSGGHHAFHHYGPPPPLPPPMPHSLQGQSRPLSMPSIYHQPHRQPRPHTHQQTHPHTHPIPHTQPKLKPQPHPQSQHQPQPQPQKLKQNQQQPQYYHGGHHQHQHHHQRPKLHQQQHKPQPPHMHPRSRQPQHQPQQHYPTQDHHHYQRHHQYPHYGYNQVEGASKANNNVHRQGPKQRSSKSLKAIKLSSGRGGSVSVYPDLSNSAVDVTVDVKVSVRKEEATGGSSMTHDEAMRLCHLVGKDSPGQNRGDQHGGTFPADSLLSNIPSFDFGEQHSLSSQDAGDMSQDMANADTILQRGENQDDILDLIRGEMFPLGLGEDDTFESVFDMNI